MAAAALVDVAPALWQQGPQIAAFNALRQRVRENCIGEAHVPHDHFSAHIQPVLQEMTIFGELKGDGDIRLHADFAGSAGAPIQAGGDIAGDHAAAPVVVAADALDDRGGRALGGSGEAGTVQAVDPQIRQGHTLQPLRIHDFNAAFRRPAGVENRVRMPGWGGCEDDAVDSPLTQQAGAGVAVAAVAAGTAGDADMPDTRKAVEGGLNEGLRRPFHYGYGSNAGGIEIMLFAGLHGLGGNHALQASPSLSKSISNATFQ